MVTLDIKKDKLRFSARASIQLTSRPTINSEHIARGIFNSRISCSFVFDVNKTCNLFVSTFDTGLTEDVKTNALTKLKTLSAFFPGCTYQDVDMSIQTTGHPVALHVVGIPHIGYANQMKEILNGISYAEIPATIFLNIHPLDQLPESNETSQEDTMRRKLLTSDCRFLVNYFIFTGHDNINILKMNLDTIVGLIGSVYDSEHSKMKIYVEEKEAAIKSLQKIIWGELSYSTILTTRELKTYLQIPEIYGITEITTPDLFVPTMNQHGGVEIGQVMGNYGERLYPALISPDTLFQHLAIWGATGYGKSTFLKHLIVNLHNDFGIKTLIFDLHNEYREIAYSLNGTLGEDVIVLNPYINDFSINPLALAGSQRDKETLKMETVENFISLLKQMATIGENQEQRLRRHHYNLYKTKDNPIIQELITLLEKDMRTKMKKDEDTLPLKLEKFTTGLYGRIFNQPDTSLPFERIENSTTIIELGELPIEVRTFFVTVFLIQWWNYIRTKNKQEHVPHILVLDEFHHYDNMLIPRKLLSEGRKYKEGLICSHQGPFQITDRDLLGDLIRNTVNKVAFRQLYKEDINITLASMGLQGREWPEYLTRLEIGEAIVTLKGFPQPFKIGIEPFPTINVLQDEDIKGLNELLMTDVALEEETEEETALNDDREMFLQSVYENPFSSTNAIIDNLQIMRKRGFELKNELVEEGFLKEESVRTGGRPKKVLMLTDDAYDLLNVEKHGDPAHYGGAEHIMMINEIAQMLKDDLWAVMIEWNGTDIKAENQTNKLAIEVETCKNFNPDQILKNIQRDLLWADLVVVVSPNKKSNADIQRLIRTHGIEKVELLTYSDVQDILEVG